VFETKLASFLRILSFLKLRIVLEIQPGKLKNHEQVINNFHAVIN